MAKAGSWGIHPCSIEGCSERRVSRGWCAKHYQRWLRLGDPMGPVRAYESRAVLPSPGSARSKAAAVVMLGRAVQAPLRQVATSMRKGKSDSVR